MKILYFDIETFPLLAHVWSKFVDGSVIAIEREWTLASVAWRWSDRKRTQVETAYPTPHDDERLVRLLWELFDEADVVIGHNANGFDIKKAQSRMLLLGLQPPSPFQSIDTLAICRRHFNLTSNRLGDVCQQLGIGGKVETGGWQLWADCLEGDKAAWDKMARYNKVDVDLLPELYERLRPWMTSHPVLHLAGCPTCGSDHIQSRGTRRVQSLTYRQFQCQSCGAWFKSARSTAAEKPVYKGAVRR